MSPAAQASVAVLPLVCGAAAGAAVILLLRWKDRHR